MLTMADISLVKVRSKQVELSYCHSANGQIRSVLVALWAILDSAVEQLGIGSMNAFTVEKVPVNVFTRP